MTPKNILPRTKIADFIDNLYDGDLHAKRVLPLANATLGVLVSASLAVHAIGQGLAQALGKTFCVVPALENSKHGVKQVDRLLSNQGVDVWEFFGYWIPYLVGARTEVVERHDGLHPHAWCACPDADSPPPSPHHASAGPPAYGSPDSPRPPARHEPEAPRRCPEIAGGWCGSCHAAPRRASHDESAHGPATRSIRWGRHPAPGTSWPPHGRPGSPSRARRPPGHRAGLPSKPDRGFF